MSARLAANDIERSARICARSNSKATSRCASPFPSLFFVLCDFTRMFCRFVVAAQCGTGHAAQGASAEVAWRKLIELVRGALDREPTTTLALPDVGAIGASSGRVHGNARFGLALAPIRRALQQLPGLARCERYVRLDADADVDAERATSVT